MSPRRFALALCALVVLAAAVRLPALGRDGLWTDEATTVVLCERPVEGLLAALRADVQAPLYYLLEKAALSVAPPGEAGARALSVLAGLLAVLAVGLLGRALAGPVAGLASASLLAASPMAVSYSREARAYAVLMLLSVVAVAATDRLRREPSIARAVACGLALALLPLTHGLGAMHAAGIGLAFTLPARGERASFVDELPRFAIAGCVAVAASLPWMAVTAGQGARLSVAYAWAERAWQAWFPWQVPLSLAALSPGASAPMRSLWMPGPLDVAAAALALAIAAAAFARRARLPDPSVPGRLLGTLLIALGLVFLASCAVAPVHVVGRAEAALAPVMALLAGCGLAAMPGLLRAASLGVVLALSALSLRAAIPETWKSEERTAFRWVAVRASPRDVVVVLGAYRFPAEYYLPREMPGAALASFPPDRERHPSWVDWARALPSAEADAEAFAARLAGELAMRPGGEVVLMSLPEPTTPALEQALARRFRPRMTWDSNLPGVTVWHYERP